MLIPPKYSAQRGFVPWTREDDSKNLSDYETMNGRGIMEAESERRLSWGHTTTRLPPTEHLYCRLKL